MPDFVDRPAVYHDAFCESGVLMAQGPPLLREFAPSIYRSGFGFAEILPARMIDGTPQGPCHP
jgi:hypothetical protein